MSDLSGRTIAGYEIIEELGKGGMGAVYKARQPMLNRFAALKVMADYLLHDADSVARFDREINLAAQLNHPNLVQVYSAGTQGNIHYMAMEFVEGETLRQRIANRGRIEPRMAVGITISVVEALQYAWNKMRLVHRDIKPGNIFLSKSGDVKLGDLGLARSTDATSTEMTTAGRIMGSPSYISPEQARGIKDMDFRSDIYSLGCTLYQMLTGLRPYEGDDTMAIIAKHLHEPPPAIFKAWPACPVQLGLLVGKMLAKDRNARHQSYEELIADLLRIQEQTKPAAVSAPQVTTLAPPETPEPRARDSRLVIGSIAGAALLALAGIFVWSPWKTPSQSPTRSTTRETPERTTATALKLLGKVYTNTVGAEMVYIPPGKFLLGSTKEEQTWAVGMGANAQLIKNEGEQPTPVTIRTGFWMGRTEVTLGQWKQFVEETGYVTEEEKKPLTMNAPQEPGKPPAQKKRPTWREPVLFADITDNLPVCCVSWNDAKAFCEWLDGRERAAGRLPRGYQARLPRELEWEYACRAGTQTKFWWGDIKEEGRDRANWSGTSDGIEFISPVDHYAQRGRNAFGLADMLGNVMEWCLDRLDPRNPNSQTMTENSPYCVARGGAFGSSYGRVRCAYRFESQSAYASHYTGLRVVVGDAP